MQNYKYKKLLIIDGSFLMHRTLSVERLYEQKNVKGQATGGISGCLKTLEGLLKIPEFKGYFPVFTWDRGINPRRKNLDKDYKKEKAIQTGVEQEKTHDEYISMYREQRNKLIDVLSGFGIPSIIFENTEGDDLAKVIIDNTQEVIFVTSDKDWLQNLDSDRVYSYDPIKKKLRTLNKFLTENNYESIYQFLLEKILIGDPSDNIPSPIKGVGEKGMHEFYKFIKLFKTEEGWNFDSYPTEINECKKLCEDNGIAYKKAYLNFDKERFFINEQLIDLKFIDIDEQTKKSIDNTIQISQQNKSFMQVMRLLNSYNITNVDADTLIREIAKRKNSIYM